MSSARSAKASRPARSRNGNPSVLPDMLTLLGCANVVSFALGLPDPELFPVEEWMRAATRVAGAGPRAFQYGAPDPQLKSHIRTLMARRGVSCHEDQILVTAGAQQGLCLLARLLLKTNRVAAVEEFTYPNFSEVLRQLDADVLTVPTDAASGLDVSAFEAILGGNERPSLLYVMPDGHNPLGVTLSAERRVALVRLARQHGVPIVEDDTYGLLAYESPVPPLRALDDEWVFYVGSLSKTLAPAVRIGWIVAPSRVVSELAMLKEASDINTATFDQRVTTAYLETGAFPDHLTRLRIEYAGRRDVLLDTVRRSFPAGTRVVQPDSGFFAWLQLPPGIDTTALLHTAIEQAGVAFIPGAACRALPDGLGTDCLRLNFSHPTPDRIRDAIPRLARAIESAASIA
jgi:2-aminoadipate transaminase